MSVGYLVRKIYQWGYKLLHRDVQFQAKTEFGIECKFYGHNLIAYGADLQHITLGYGSYIGEFACLRGVIIGKYTSIGPYVKTYVGRHPTNKFVSSHPAFYALKPPCGFSYVEKQKYEEVKFAVNDMDFKYPICIGNDVWIGAGTCICDGVTIGDGAVIGANSLVLEDVAPYTIVAGVPAKTIRMRFPKDDIEWLMSEKWWNKQEKWIKEHADSFENLDSFREYYEK